MRNFFTILLLGAAIMLASCKEEETAIKVSGVKLNKDAITLEIGAIETLVATVEPSDAEDKMVIWSSSAEAIATVDKAGKVTAVAAGSAVIKATAGVFSATCNVTISSESTMNGISFVHIPAGVFMMGSPESEFDSDPTERPVHQVTLTKSFRMSKYEITNAQFAKFLNDNKVPSTGIWSGAMFYKAEKLIYQSEPDLGDWGLVYANSNWAPVEGKDNFPVVYVTYCGAVEFAAWMDCVLPTEAQWEYACRAGSTTPFNLGAAGNGNQLFGTMANFNGRNAYDVEKGGNYYDENGIRLGETCAVGSYQPNAWGLYDMHGNVREWCLDWWDEQPNYPSEALIDPVMIMNTTNTHITRGGAYFQPGRFCRSAARMGYDALVITTSIGFRVVAPIGQ